MSEFICGDCMEGMKRFPDGSEKVRTEEDYRRAFAFLSVGIMPTDNMLRATASTSARSGATGSAGAGEGCRGCLGG